MMYDACYCDFKNGADSKITRMNYQGEGKFKCPKCGHIENFSECIYTITLKYEQKVDEDYSWVEASIIEPYDKRLDVVAEGYEKSGKTLRKIIEEEILEDGFALKHELGVFTTDLLYNWHNDYSPEYGDSWDLDLEIITEKLLEGK
jgi:hypothetical protein